MEPIYRKLWAGSLLKWSDLSLDPSSKVKRGYPNLKSGYNLLIFGPTVSGCETDL